MKKHIGVDILVYSLPHLFFCLYFLFSTFKDEKLKKLVEQHGTESWKLIASFFPVSI